MRFLTGFDGEGPFSPGDLVTVADAYDDQPSDQYMFVANRSDFPDRLNGQRQTGINLYFTGRSLERRLDIFRIEVQGIHVFADAPGHAGTPQRVRKTAIHEIAHSFQIGELDDDCDRASGRGGEIYSGDRSPEDRTIEQVRGESRWSIMSAGWSSDLTIDPMNGQYFSFSIEELLTATTSVEQACGF